MANPNPEPHPENLRPAKPGEVRNPNGINGHQDRKRLTKALLKLMDEQGLDSPFVRAGMHHALKGDFNFWKYIYERLEGRLPDPDEQPELELKEFARKLKNRKRKPKE